MLFPEEDTPLLKTWIVKRIENTSDADSDVLADYVIALLKHDGPVDTVRQLCEEEIPMFLTEDSHGFLDDVFKALTYKTYRAGAAQPVKKNNSTSSHRRPTHSSPTPAVLAKTENPQLKSNTKKRNFHNRGENDGPSVRDDGRSGSRPTKQPRRGRRGGGPGRDNGSSFRGMPSFNPMEALMQMQTLGLFPGLAGQSARENAPLKSGRCPDFDSKGFCSRGSTCPYDHGFMPRIRGGDKEYNPRDADQIMANANSQLNSFAQMLNADFGNSNRRKGRGGWKGSRRTALSEDGPVHDRSKSTIVIENIPEESFAEEHVKSFFSQFGEIIEISMQPYKHLAVVKYDSWTSADAAYRSPKVIFDNRFVKIFWYKEPSDTISAPNALGHIHGPQGDGSPQDEEVLDIEEFSARQAEAQKSYVEREAKRTELDGKRQDLEKQQRALLEKHKEENDRLQARLAGNNGGPAASGTEMLRAKLASLEQEAKILGIDPDAMDDGAIFAAARGGYAGRGRAAFRGRGFAPRRRGAFRGPEGRHAAYAQYTLDNRPKKLAVKGVDFTESQKDETLRHFLLNLGEFESVETTPEVTYVSFQDRKTAERFYYTLHDKELAGVDGKLDLSWVTSPSAPNSNKMERKLDTLENGDGDQNMEETFREGSEEGELEPVREDRVLNMDYEVANDEPWDQE